MSEDYFPVRMPPSLASRYQLQARVLNSGSIIIQILTVWFYSHNKNIFYKYFLACNILMSDMTGLFTLQNHGKAMNCSLTTLLFPANFELRAMAVGPFTSSRYRRETDAVSQGLSTNCDPDFVELGGSAELDSSHLVTSHTLCGTQNSPGKGLTVLCGSSTVRLYILYSVKYIYN